MHGFGCAKECFDPAFQFPRLGGASMCAVDFPGHGSSPAFDGIRHDLETYADVTNLVIEQLDPGRVFIVGHSMGGAVATIAASSRRDAECVVSVEGNLVAQDCGIVSRDVASQSRTEFSGEGFPRFLAGLRRSGRSDLQTWARWCEPADATALHELARSLVDWSDSGRLLDLFNSLAGKAYIHGDEGDAGRYVLPRLRGARTYRIAAAGHFLMTDQPTAFYRTLADHLDLVA